MKHFIKPLFVIFLLSNFWTLCSQGQTGSQYHLDITNGLPSNHIYHGICDRQGYIWIATEKGIVRYNGYECRVFNLTDGLPKLDIWELMEDHTGRIWLGSISDEYGFIYNGKYHRAFVKGGNRTIYPQSARAAPDGGVVFYSANIDGENKLVLCRALNDTIRKFDINRGLLGLPSDAEWDVAAFVSDNGHVFVVHNGIVYSIAFSGDSLKVTNKLKADKLANFHSSSMRNRIMGDYIFSFVANAKSNKISALNVRTGKVNLLDLSLTGINENVEYLHGDDAHKVVNVFTNKDVLVFDYANGCSLRNTYHIIDLVSGHGIDKSKMKLFIEDDLWNKCIGSTSDGMWIDHGVIGKFKRDSSFDLTNFKNVGGKPDVISFWWSALSKTLVGIEQNKIIKYNDLSNITRLPSVIDLGNDTFLATSFGSYYLLRSSDKIWPLNYRYDLNILNGIKVKDSRTFFINTAGFFTMAGLEPDLRANVIDYDRYDRIIYDSLRNNCWVYNTTKVFIYSVDSSPKKASSLSGLQKSLFLQDGHCQATISKELLQVFGVEKVEKIVTDNRYGNIFFKGSEYITMFDQEKVISKRLFEQFNLRESSIYVYRNTLIVPGRFGILFSKIKEKNIISNPVLYPNIKNAFYHFVYDCDVSWGKVTLNTDQGVYTVTIPSDSEMITAPASGLSPKYRPILNYRDTISNFKSGDTISLHQNYRRLQFDIINPAGNGHIKYLYRIGDSVWRDLNANELTLPGAFTPDNFYTLSIKVYDDVWRSDDIDLVLFIRPFWYQTHAAQKLIFISETLLFILLLAGSVLVTRKLVLRAAKKRNLRMELELKAIYSQINPHFIFNTLNSALLLVNKNKMEEAYEHISKFSRLLRSYIKSSRNKLISLSEELSNLRDYIELQQTRFKNKFVYEIHIGESIRPERVKIPSLLIQPFVENAINHGLLHKQEMGHLKIEFTMTGAKNEIICTVEDDGVGRKQSEIIDSQSERTSSKDGSYGDLLIKDLVNIFNRYENMNIEIRYTDKDGPITGTIVTIQIKNPHYAE